MVTATLVFLVFQSDVVFPKQQDDNGMLSLAERFTNKLEQPRFTWLTHYLAKAINLCGQACKAGLSVQIAHNQEVCVQLCICPSRTLAVFGFRNNEWQLFILIYCAVYMTCKSFLHTIPIIVHCVELGKVHSSASLAKIRVQFQTV